MSRITVNLQPNTKERLENVVAKYRKKNLNDGIDSLMDDYQLSLKRIDELQQANREQLLEIKNSYVHVDVERKEILLNLKYDFNLQSEAHVIDMLLDVYYSSSSIDRAVFDKWMLRRSV